MKTTNKSQSSNSAAASAIAFYNPEGLVPAWKSAAAFGGKDGRVATLPDIIAARLATPCRTGEPAWDNYFTTSSAEYMGVGANGRKLIIVAHGVGPMATIDGVLKAYSHEFKDRERNRRGGRISRAEFLKLEAGEYGPVHVVDLEEFNSRYKYPFIETLRAGKALAEPLVAARLGPDAAAYVARHAVECRAYQQEHRRLDDPHIIQLGDASNCSYRYGKLAEDQAFAHLLSIGGMMPTGHSDDQDRYDSLLSDVSLHEWSNGVRLAGIQGTAAPAAIRRGLADFDVLLKKHMDKVYKPVSEPTEVGLRLLTKVGKQYFTEYLKQGERMDTGEPEFAVTSIEPVAGGPEVFTTTVGGYHGFFKYGIKEVEAIAPAGANAYAFTGGVGFGGKGHIVGIAFFKVTVDTSRRLRRMSEIYNDVELLLQLLD